MPESVIAVVIWSVALLIVVALVMALVAILLRLQNERKAEVWAAREARWTPIFLDVLSGTATEKELLAAVRKGEERAFVGFLTSYATRVRGEEKELIRRLAEPWLPFIVEDRRRKDAERRARVLQTVAELGMPKYEHVLVDALDDESPLVAMVAARRLFRPGNEERFDQVLDHLDDFEVWDRRFVASLLARGGPNAVEYLREILRDRTRSRFARVSSLEALTVLHDIQTADYAVQLLGDDTDDDLRVAALRHLRETGIPDHSVRVRTLLDHPKSVIRQAAVRTLGAIGRPADDADRIADLLDDRSPWVRVAAARALDALGARTHLLRAAESEGPEGEVAREVLRA